MYILKDTQSRSTCTLNDSQLQNFDDEAQTKIANKITCFKLHNYLMAPNSTFPKLMFYNESDVSLIYQTVGHKVSFSGMTLPHVVS